MYSVYFILFFMTVRGYDFTIQENGLQIDQPPEIGNISIVRIIIMKMIMQRESLNLTQGIPPLKVGSVTLLINLAPISDQST